MFSLQIHSVDTNSLLTISSGNDSSSTNPNPKIQESRGIIHLYRNISKPSLPKPSFDQSTLLFVVAVPSYISSDDFLHFCGSYIEYITEIFLVRNDGMEERYSVLIKLVDKLRANEFYRNFNGRRFSATEAEVCHILLTASVEFTELAEIAGTAPHGFTELPTCPVCLERLDQDTSGILITLCDHSFQCPCISKWTDSSCLVCRFCQQQDAKPTCSTCGTSENLWICVICGFIGCGRYKERHAIQHWRDTQHCYSLDLENQRVWDYVGDTYVHRLNQSKTDGKSEGVHSYCRSSDGDCTACEYSEESGISGSPINNKIEEIVDEYNHLLASELEIQRQYYEKLLVEANVKKEKSIPEGVEKAVNSKMQEFEDKMKRTIEAKNAVAASNEKLMKEQEIWRKKLEEIDERIRSTIKIKDDQIVDMEEQIRDLTVYVQAQRTLNKMNNSDAVGGTVLPVPLQQSSASNNKRRPKTNRRRS